MRLRSVWTSAALFAAIVALAVVVIGSPAAAQDSNSDKDILRIGWAQDPQLARFIAHLGYLTLDRANFLDRFLKSATSRLPN